MSNPLAGRGFYWPLGGNLERIPRPGKGARRTFRIDSRGYYELSDSEYGSDWSGALEPFIEGLEGSLESIPEGVKHED